MGVSLKFVYCYPNAASECPVQKGSFERMDHLRQLQNIIQATSREIMWINDCEEEELLYDWSDKNTNIAQKQEAFSVSSPPAPFRVGACLVLLPWRPTGDKVGMNGLVIISSASCDSACVKMVVKTHSFLKAFQWT